MPTQELISFSEVSYIKSVRDINSSGLTLTVLCINCVSKISISTELTVPACCAWLTYQTGARQAVTAARDGEVKVVIALAWLTWSSRYGRLSKIAFCTPKVIISNSDILVCVWGEGYSRNPPHSMFTYLSYSSARIIYFPLKRTFSQMQSD